MKILTIVGTRPEFIRLSRIIPKLNTVCNHILVHTGQNYDKNLNDIFFKELEIREPDYYMGAKGSFGKQIGMIMEQTEVILKKEKPDKVLILGDTNTDLSAFIAERMGIPVYHMEAGNRCWDKRVPEEVNRHMIDHVSTYNFPYTENSKNNLLREGIDNTKIIVSGNPIYEVMKYYDDKITTSDILQKLNLIRGSYFLATFHRAETVDDKVLLAEIIWSLNKIYTDYGCPVICSIHPRTREKIEQFNLLAGNIVFLNPMGFFDFVKLESSALCILSDSGTVCEEACILRVPHVIMRDSTERPETVQVGASIISGIDRTNIANCTRIILAGSNDWQIPEGYNVEDVSYRMIKYLMGKI